MGPSIHAGKYTKVRCRARSCEAPTTVFPLGFIRANPILAKCAPSLFGDEKTQNCEIAEILLNRKVEQDGVLVFDHDLAFVSLAVASRAGVAKEPKSSSPCPQLAVQ